MRVSEYVEYNFEYFAKVGVSTLIVFVTLINEVYRRRIVVERINKSMYNLVDIR